MTAGASEICRCPDPTSRNHCSTLHSPDRRRAACFRTDRPRWLARARSRRRLERGPGVPRLRIEEAHCAGGRADRDECCPSRTPAASAYGRPSAGTAVHRTTPVSASHAWTPDCAAATTISPPEVGAITTRRGGSTATGGPSGSLVAASQICPPSYPAVTRHARPATVPSAIAWSPRLSAPTTVPPNDHSAQREVQDKAPRFGRSAGLSPAALIAMSSAAAFASGLSHDQRWRTPRHAPSSRPSRLCGSAWIKRSARERALASATEASSA